MDKQINVTALSQWTTFNFAKDNQKAVRSYLKESYKDSNNNADYKSISIMGCFCNERFL